MKKLLTCFMAACLLLTIIPLQSIAANPTVSSATDIIKPPVTANANTALLRLKEIKEMDKSNLSSSEKRTLRKEVRSLKHELKRDGKGVYLSVGAIIIIILLLILIF